MGRGDVRSDAKFSAGCHIERSEISPYFYGMLGNNYFVYITTNPTKTTLYIGVTNDLPTRIRQHKENRGQPGTFAGKYYCYNLIYYERFTNPSHAIEREKELKKWRREKKENLIATQNPKWQFHNSESLT